MAYLASLSLYTVPLTGDQKVYLATAKEMWDAGSFFQPLLFGAPSYLKPPLQYLAILLSWKIFGVSLFGALLPSVLGVVGTSYFLGKISFQFSGRSFASNAGLWFAASVGAWVFGTVAQMEILLCLFDAFAWFLALRFLTLGRWSYLFAAFAVAGLNAWLKSPLYSVLWTGGFLFYLFLTGNWWVLRHRRFYAAGILGAAIGSVWYVAMFAKDPQGLWTQYFLQETFGKKGGNASTPWGLWGALIYWAFPGSLLLIPGFLRAFRFFRAHRPLGPVWNLALAWGMPAFLFFSFHPYRVKPYLFVLVPPVCLLLDWTVSHCRNDRLFIGLLRFTGAWMGIGGLFASFLLFRTEWISAWVLIFLGLAACVAAWLAWKRRLRGFATASAVVLLAFRFAAADLGSHDLADLRAWSAANPSGRLAYLDPDRNVWNERASVGLGIQREITRVETDEQVQALLNEGGFLILSDEQWEKGGWMVRPEIQTSEWKRFRTRKKFPYADLLLKGRAGLPGFDDDTHRIFRIIGHVAETRK